MRQNNPPAPWSMGGCGVSMLDESVNVVLCLFSTVRQNNPPAPWSMGGPRVSMLDESVNVVIFVFYSETKQPTSTLVNGWSPCVYAR